MREGQSWARDTARTTKARSQITCRAQNIEGRLEVFFSFYVALLKSFDKWFWSRFLFFLQSMTKIIIICLRPKRIGFRRCVGMCVSVCCAHWSIDNMILLFMHSLWGQGVCSWCSPVCPTNEGQGPRHLHLLRPPEGSRPKFRQNKEALLCTWGRKRDPPDCWKRGPSSRCQVQREGICCEKKKNPLPRA